MPSHSVPHDKWTITYFNLQDRKLKVADAKNNQTIEYIDEPGRATTNKRIALASIVLSLTFMLIPVQYREWRQTSFESSMMPWQRGIAFSMIFFMFIAYGCNSGDSGSNIGPDTTTIVSGNLPPGIYLTIAGSTADEIVVANFTTIKIIWDHPLLSPMKTDPDHLVIAATGR